MNNLIEHNENLDTPLNLPTHLECLKQKHDYFEVPDLETKIQRHANPHYWLQQDILQVNQFQYTFFQNIILNENTVPQIKIFPHFLSKLLRFNYKLLWEQQDHNAYITFSQKLTETELLPYNISNRIKHFHYRDLTSLKINYFEIITYANNFIVEHSETFDNRPYTTSNTFSEPSFGEYDQSILQSNQDDNTKIFHNPIQNLNN